MSSFFCTSLYLLIKIMIKPQLIAITLLVLISCVEHKGEPVLETSGTDSATSTQPSTFEPDSAEMLQKLQAYVYDSTIYDTYLPAGVKTYLATHLQDWQLPHPEMWDALWFQSYKKPDALVNLISGDFNCDGQSDYALLLSYKKDSTIGTWIIQSAEAGYNPIKLEAFEKPEDHIQLGLELIEQGMLNYIDPDADTTRSLKLACPAVQVTYFEKGATAYYWNKGEYNTVQTGD